MIVLVFLVLHQVHTKTRTFFLSRKPSWILKSDDRAPQILKKAFLAKKGPKGSFLIPIIQFLNISSKRLYNFFFFEILYKVKHLPWMKMTYIGKILVLTKIGSTGSFVGPTTTFLNISSKHLYSFFLNLLQIKSI